MAIKEIEINTVTLLRDIDILETKMGELDGQTEKMFSAISDLDTMWDGPASEAFKEQFQLDYQSCKEMSKVLKDLVESLKHARQEYDTCEQNVEDLIRAIQI